MTILVLAVVLAVGLILVMFLVTALTGAPYVPTHRREIQAAYNKLRPLTRKDVVLDIGSGDGTVLKEAADKGVRAVGYEINFFLVWYSRWRLRGYNDRVQIEFKNLWSADFPDDVTLVYTFGETRDIARMYTKVQHEATRLGRPLELISYGFAVPGKKPLKKYRAHFLYKVPALHSREA